MPDQQPASSLYCYVDETGQDTEGDLFVVSVIVSRANRDHLAAALEKAEQITGKGKSKWISARHSARVSYIRAVLSTAEFRGTLFFSVYRGSKSYMALTVLSTAKAILSAAPEVPATVYVDGLPKARLRWFGTELRHLSVRTKKVSGVRRENPMLLFAWPTRVAGLFA